MKSFIQREWQSVFLWSLAGLLLWYALSVDREKLVGALGLIATGVVFELIHRAFGANSEDRD